MQTEKIKKDSSDGNKSSNLKSEVISDKSNTVPKLSESDDEVNNQKPLTLPEEQKLKDSKVKMSKQKPIHMVIANKMTSLIMKMI